MEYRLEKAEPCSGAARRPPSDDDRGPGMSEAGASPGRPARTKWLGLWFDNLDCGQAIGQIRARDPAAAFGYMTTPNVDHMVRLWTEYHKPEIERAYRHAEITLCDSQVMALLARLRGVRLAVAPGSDVTEALMHVAGTDDRIAIVGGDTDTLPALVARYGFTDIHQHMPPFGLLANEAALDAAAEFIAATGARYTFIAVGSPQQEIVALRAASRHASVGFGLCVGASIDFLTGRSRRAPRLVRRLALEWLYRLVCEPRRLWHRYLVRSPRIFRLIGKRDDDR